MKKVIKIIGVIFFIFILMIFLVTKSWELPDDNIGKIDLVIEEQSLQVDAICGATYSSSVILKSIENGLTK